MRFINGLIQISNSTAFFSSHTKTRPKLEMTEFRYIYRNVQCIIHLYRRTAEVGVFFHCRPYSAMGFIGFGPVSFPVLGDVGEGIGKGLGATWVAASNLWDRIWD